MGYAIALLVGVPDAVSAISMSSLQPVEMLTSDLAMTSFICEEGRHGRLAIPPVHDEKTDHLADILEAGGHDGPLWTLTAEAWSAAAEASTFGAIACLEAEFFGGLGWQFSVVWEHGEVVMAPALVDDGHDPSGEWPINAALRRLGVRASPGLDEFDTVGLAHLG